MRKLTEPGRRQVFDRIHRTFVRWQTSHTALWCQGWLMSTKSGAMASLDIPEGVLKLPPDGSFQHMSVSSGGSFAASGDWNDAIVVAIEEGPEGLLLYAAFSAGILFIADYDATRQVKKAVRRMGRVVSRRSLLSPPN